MEVIPNAYGTQAAAICLDSQKGCADRHWRQAVQTERPIYSIFKTQSE
jgi:hypothetical protein